MDEALKQYIQSLPLTDEEKERLLKEFKADQKKIETLEFKFKRTLIDKTAITNILNASIAEIEKQKKIIENTKDEINRNLNEMDQQKKLIEEKNSELNTLLSNLKATQAQLIQSEKMASLGELTAGIAHEIQNPLNFINNFSDINNELIDEIINATTYADAKELKLLSDDIKSNNDKILFHGKRADGIVKGMLQHSRKRTDIKEPTDINALCDEYLRLSYHGLRAKDKSFNADFKTDFDEDIDRINTVPQDVGRVLLNLFNNAFYAVTNKKKTAGENYKPMVTVHTRKIKPFQGMEAFVEIIVTDNGNGIPQNIIDKIFQPFFTTKPTGEGTGLGLSLAYDIITKEHNGTIKVESKDGEGSEFIIRLPA